MESLKKAGAQEVIANVGEDKEVSLVNCQICGRHFAADRIETHEWICQKQKNRKPFDVGQQRVKGTDAEKFYDAKGRTKSEKNMSSSEKSWRKQHEEFVMSLKAAREMSALLKKGGNVKDLPPPPRSDYSDYVQCPTCLRKFNPTAANRHIPKCAEIQQRKPKPTAQKQPISKPAKPKEMSARTRK